jgi:hypothetical protein
MGLTAERELALRDANLTDFFDKHKKTIRAMTKTAYKYAKSYVDSVSLPLRQDDVAEILIPALTTNEPLREYLQDAGLRQKYWYKDFANLALDRLWEEVASD